jgi:archaellum component FlaC
MKRRFELDVLRIEELGDGPFTFTVWTDNVLQEPSHNDRVPLPGTGTLTVNICTDEITVGSVKLPLDLITHNACCWLPLDFTEVLTELLEKGTGPRALVSFTNLELLSPVSEHGSVSERSFEDRGSPCALRRKVASLSLREDEGLKSALQEVLSVLKVYSDQKTDLKRKILSQDRELQAMKLSLAQERVVHQHRPTDDHSLETEKLSLLVKSQAVDLREVVAKYESIFAELKEERQAKQEFEQRATARIKDLEGQLALSLSREKAANASVCSLQQETTDLRQTLGDCKAEVQELSTSLWKLRAEAPHKTDVRVLALHEKLEESEKARTSVVHDLHQLQDFIARLECQEAATQVPSLKLQLLQMNEEVQRLTEELADAQEEAIRLQSYEDCMPLNSLSAQIAEINQRAASEVDEVKRRMETQGRVLCKLSESCAMTAEDLHATQGLLKAKLSQLHSMQVENLNLRSQVEAYQLSDCTDDTDRALKDFLHSNGYRNSLSKVGDGLYMMGNKKLRILLKNDKLLVRTGGGFTSFGDYIRTEKAEFNSELKKCSSANSKSFSNRSSSAGLVPRNLENYAHDPKDTDTTLDYDSILLQSFTFDDTSFRRNAQQSTKLDITKPTKSSIGKRAERTPLKSHNTGARTPIRTTQKRMPFKM